MDIHTYNYLVEEYGIVLKDFLHKYEKDNSNKATHGFTIDNNQANEEPTHNKRVKVTKIF